jgi:hypothetical protein
MNTQKRLYCWVVLGCLGAALTGCSSDSPMMSWSDIGSPDDMAAKQAESRANRAIPKATEMPPGLGEDLPLPPQSTPAVTQTR